MIRTIDNHDWPAFCQRVTEQRATALVKVEVIESDGIKIEKAVNASLQSMTFDSTDPCNDFIILRFKNTREIAHEMLAPIQIRLHRSATSSDFNTIEIEAENGITTITLSPSIHLQMLEGLKLS